jgi:nucleoside-diphosphate-sugar epimerase
VRILVTGSAGFIGSHIVWYLDKKHEVHEIDLAGDGYPYGSYDALDFFRREDYHYDLVIHCAALVGGRQKIENSPVAYAQNLELDAALFQWAERTKPGRIVYISSVAAYPVYLQQPLPPMSQKLQDSYDALSELFSRPKRELFSYLYPRELREEDIDLDRPYLPDKVYGWAKLTGEMLASQSSVPVSVVRPFTVYGDGQDEIFPFANIMKQVKNYRDPVTVWGSGNQVRDFIHVDDVVNAILVMAEQGINGPVNLCTGRAVSLVQLAAMMAGAADYSPDIEHHDDKPEGLPYRVGNPEKLHGFYVPRISLEEGIERGLR